LSIVQLLLVCLLAGLDIASLVHDRGTARERERERERERVREREREAGCGSGNELRVGTATVGGCADTRLSNERR
jgi:hypothetical protein